MIITLGFELETQETEGKGYHSMDDEFERWAEEQAEDYVTDDGDLLISCAREHLGEVLSSRQAHAVLDALGIDTLADFDKEFDTNYYEDAIDDRICDIRDDPASWGWDPSSSLPSVPGDIEVDEDGSVEGFEFRTIGGNTLERCIQLAADLFEMDHVIDDDCSFHVHAAERYQLHEYNREAHLRMYNYILQQVTRIPTAVLERITGPAGRSWCRPHLSIHKGPAISYRHRTWEFRLWGNVSTLDMAEVCLTLTQEAMEQRFNEELNCSDELLDTWVEVLRSELNSRQEVAA